MSARQEVNELLRRWFELTQEEAGAIQSAAWSNVRQIQSAKGALQPTLTAAVEKWTLENGRGALSGNHPFRAEVNRLLSLESRNAALLAEQVRRAKLEKAQRAEGLRNLRLLRGSYASKLNSHWQSFS